jgi:hypothetical protein
VDLSGTLRIDFHDLPIRVQNISQGGAKVTSSLPARAGSRCEIQLDGLPMRTGTIVWWRDMEGGLVFQRSLSFAEFAAWRTAC